MAQRGRRGQRVEGERRGHGEGEITELPDGRFRWRVRVTLPTRETRRPSGTAPNLKAARAAIRTAIKAAEAGRAVDRSKLTVGEYVEEWIKTRESLSERTRDMYADYLRLYIRPLLGSVQLTGVTPARLREFYVDIRKPREVDGKQLSGLGDSARLHVHNILHGAFAQAYGDGLTPSNPAKVPNVRPKAGAVEERELKAFTPAEAQQFRDAAMVDRAGVLLAFMLLTGLRRGETLGLRWGVVDLAAGTLDDGVPFGTVNVRVTRSQSGARVYEGPPKTVAARRVITVTGEALDLLHAVQARTETERASRLHGYEATPYVFTTGRGTPYRPDNIGRVMERVCQAACVRQLSPHALRHLCLDSRGARRERRGRERARGPLIHSLHPQAVPPRVSGRAPAAHARLRSACRHR